MNIDWRFCLKIDLNIDESKLFEIIEQSLPECERTGGYIKYAKNIITLYHNTLQDPVRAKVDPDAWLYYTFDLSVFPIVGVDLDNQMKLIEELTSIVQKLNGATEIVAEFDM